MLNSENIKRNFISCVLSAARTSFDESRLQETIQKFFKYHLQHFEVWQNFEKLALEYISINKKVGAKKIFEDLRYSESFQKQSGSKFKLCNNFHSYYARLFGCKYPKYSNYFQFKNIKGLNSNEK